MASNELVPYSESQRDQLEDDLANNRELAYRLENGIEVFLYWHKEQNILSLFVTDVTANQSQSEVVPNNKGLEAFYHPYAYLSRLEEEYDDGA